MISIKRNGMLGRRLWAPIGVVLAVAAAGPSIAVAASAGQHPPAKARAAQQMQPAIDAQTDPAAAAAAIQAGGSASNINWQTDTAPGGCAGGVPAPAAPMQPPPCVPTSNNASHYTITDGFGPPSVFGDVLYNCSQTASAETDTGTSDMQTQTWSISEKVSLKIAVGLPNIVSVTDEVSAFSKQANSSSTQVTVTQGASVAPGYMGWTTINVATITVPGTGYVTDPIRNTITPVQDIDLYFPGYRLNPDASKAEYVSHSQKMTSSQIQAICNTSPVNVAAGHAVFGSGLTAARRSSFALSMCGPSGPCRMRTVTGSLPPSRIRRATARLTRAGHMYGWGTYSRGRTQLHVNGGLPPGTYRLKLTEPVQRVGATQHRSVTTLPVTVPAQAGA